MDEFTSISIWIFAIFLIINGSIVWFATSDTFSTNSNLAIQGITPNTLFGQEDVNDLKTAYYDESCATALPSDPQYAPCLVSNIANTFNTAVSLPGVIIGSIWTLLFSWINLLNAIFIGVPGKELFLGLLIPFFGIIQITSIFVILMRIAGIIRGGS